jgi:hypothetical protein
MVGNFRSRQRKQRIFRSHFDIHRNNLMVTKKMRSPAISMMVVSAAGFATAAGPGGCLKIHESSVHDAALFYVNEA